jgi:meso-butanediol dehydrogenase/(S,S)-butanediol dehydrogenase/diacetyl reductase
VAIVTGGGSGIGRGIVLCMAREGADVAIPDLQPDNAEKVAGEVRAVGRKAISIRCDVTSTADVQAMVDRVLREFGQVDILVNNAGTDLPAGMPFMNNTEEDWDRGWRVNVKAHFVICKALAPHMIQRQYGKIINIASIAGQLGSPTSPPYSVSKGAVITFTRALARDLAAHNVNVNAICPGLLFTPFWERFGAELAQRDPFKGMTPRQVFESRTRDMVPMKRAQVPEDIGWACVFLASDEAKNITGQSLNVDGGVYMH